MSTAKVLIRDAEAGRFPDAQDEFDFADRDRVAESRARIDRQLLYHPYRDVKVNADGLLVQAILKDFGPPPRYRAELGRAECAIAAPASLVQGDGCRDCAMNGTKCALHMTERRREIAAAISATEHYAETLDPAIRDELRKRAADLAYDRTNTRLVEMLFQGEVRKYATMHGVALA